MKTKKRFIIILTIILSFALIPAMHAKKPSNPGNSNKGGNSGGTTTTTTTGSNSNNKGGGNSNSGGGNSNSGGLVVGDPLATSPSQYYFANGYSLGGTMTVDGPVVIVSDGDFNVGNNEINITQNGSLKLYVKGDIKISGKGAFNNYGKAEKLQIWGTAKDNESQSLSVSGNGSLSAVVYAPNGDFVSNGGGNAGETMGSIIAKTIRFNGSPGPFHFDEDLMNMETDLAQFEFVYYYIGGSNSHIDNDPAQPTFESFFSSKF